MKPFGKQKGQSLLILVLMISMVLAILSAVSHRLTTDTQSTQLQEEVVSALAAADAGLEAGLRFASSAPNSDLVGPISFFNLPNLQNINGIDTIKSQVTLVAQPGTDFVTSEIEKDAQFTYYLVDPNNLSNMQFSGTVNIFFGDSSGSCDNSRNKIALELSLVRSNSVERYLVEPCASNQIGSTSLVMSNKTATEFTTENSLNKKVGLNIIGTDAKILIVRTFFNKSKLGFKAKNNVPPGTIFNQGRTIRSYAVTTSGVSRTIDVYQTLPQLPAEFFVTQF